MSVDVASIQSASGISEGLIATLKSGYLGNAFNIDVSIRSIIFRLKAVDRGSLLRPEGRSHLPKTGLIETYRIARRGLRFTSHAERNELVGLLRSEETCESERSCAATSMAVAARIQIRTVLTCNKIKAPNGGEVDAAARIISLCALPFCS